MNGHANLCWLWSPEPRLAVLHVRGPGDYYAGGGNGTCEEFCDPLAAWLPERSAGDENTGGQVSDQAVRFGTCLWATPSPSFPTDRELQLRVRSMDREKDLERESHFATFLGKWLILFSFLHDL